MSLQPSIVIGAMILSLLCFADYRQKISRVRNHASYYFFLAVFLFLNLAIYWFLCRFFADPLFTALASSASGLPTADPSSFSPSLQTTVSAVPIFVALAYFGLGANTLEFGSIKIDFYGKLLGMVESILPNKMPTDVEEAIKRSKLQCDKVHAELKALRSEAKQNKWDRLDKQWEVVDKQCEYLSGRCAILDSHLQILKSNDDDEKKLSQLNEDILKHQGESQDKMLGLYRKYLIDFICTNLRDEGEILKVLRRLGIPPVSQSETPVNVHYRCLVAGFMGGLLLAVVTKLIGKEPAGLPALALQGAVSVSVAAVIFSALANRFHDLLKVVVIGMVAGYVSYLVYMLLMPRIHWAEMNITEMLHNALTGMFYGGGLAVLLMLYKRFLASRLKNSAAGVAVLGAGGAVVVWLSFVLCSASGVVKPGEETNHLALLAAGFVIATFLGYGLDLFAEERARRTADTAMGTAKKPA